MKVQIESKKENPLLERTEVRFSAEHAGEPTPARDAVRTAIAGAVGSTKEKVVIDKMETEYGKGLSMGYAKVYSSEEALRKTESRSMLVRHGLEEKKAKVKAASKPRAAPKAK
ncbi:MAG: 30S ribosomal protein S24e [Methanomassiliicoccales archaeon]|nr:30S ribosomal protein S24e [Methanomassiliicoccales archaeon]